MLRCSKLRAGRGAQPCDALPGKPCTSLECAKLLPPCTVQVLVARADSHELFRAAQGVHSLVILLCSGCHLPLPEQLSAALRSKGSWEDGAEA